MVKKSAAFPAGLYAMLLFALAWLTLPRVFAPLERWLVGSACFVPRVGSAWMGEPAMAANREELALIGALSDQLYARVEKNDFAGAGITIPVGDTSILCGVLSVGRRGGGGEPSELLLDHTYAELAGCSEIVTKGSVLLGFRLLPGVGRAVDDGPDDPARVMLCNHRDAPRLYAGLENQDGTQLRFVIAPAALVDPAPLRVDFWDDPYRAAKLRESQQRVYTLPVAFGEQRVPGGLLVGRTRRWGYEQEDGEDTLTIGMFVTPAVAPRALSHVVVRRSGDYPSPPIHFQSSLRSRRRIQATVYDLPGATHGRHMLVAEEDVPDGAAVVQDGLFLGSARGLCLGSALVTSFAASRKDWSLLFLPVDDGAAPVELHGRVVRTEGNVAWLKWTGPSREQLARLGEGFLFTGSNGKFCPACLWIGRAVPDQFDRNLLRVTVPVLKGPRIAEVIVAEGDV
ncbi:MAG: hypothetical protein ACI89X_002231 [Planctomycetota bacterium]|jgi:hypothetical protein